MRVELGSNPTILTHSGDCPGLAKSTECLFQQALRAILVSVGQKKMWGWGD